MHWAKLTFNDVTLSLHQVVMKKLLYPLAVTTSNGLQCNQIMWPILQQGLPKMGVVQTFLGVGLWPPPLWWFGDPKPVH